MSTLLLAVAVSLPTANDRPDILFVLSDDHRNDFLSCADHPVVKTPTVDSLAAGGTRFVNAFVTTSICAASRATILTGRYESTHGFTFGTPPITPAHRLDSYPAHLKAAGYRTAFVGKLGVKFSGQLGVNNAEDKKQKPADLLDSLFDVSHVLNRNPYFKQQPDGTLRHLTDIVGDLATGIIESTPSDQPLALSISFNAAHAEDGDKKRHYPYPFAEAGLYEHAEIPEPLIERDFWESLPKFFHSSMHRDRYGWRWDTPEKYRHNYINYCRMLTGLDRNVGRMLETLKNSGRLKNTVVMFLGDNGYYAGSRGFAGKWSHYEESLRVPLVIHDFRTTDSSGKLRDEPVLNLDIAPTILDYAGLRTPRGYQGRSLRPMVEGKTGFEWRTDFFIEHRMERFDIPKYEGVREGRYKYARYYEHMTPETGGPGEFLHDLEADPEERVNLVDDPLAAAVLQRLRARTDSLSQELANAE